MLSYEITTGVTVCAHHVANTRGWEATFKLLDDIIKGRKRYKRQNGDVVEFRGNEEIISED